MLRLSRPADLRTSHTSYTHVHSDPPAHRFRRKHAGGAGRNKQHTGSTAASVLRWQGRCGKWCSCRRILGCRESTEAMVLGCGHGSSWFQVELLAYLGCRWSVLTWKGAGLTQSLDLETQACPALHFKKPSSMYTRCLPECRGSHAILQHTAE